MPGVTKEQVQKARDSDLFSYLQIYEPGVLKRDGPNYRHREHDSLVYVTDRNYWYWNSRGKSIDAIGYLMEVRGYDFIGAVERLAGNAPTQSVPPKPAARASPKEEPPKELKMPWPTRCATHSVGYLQRRGISSKVIARCFQHGLLYETKYYGQAACVFVGRDENNESKFACVRGCHGDLRKDIYGSDKRYSFCYPPEQPGSRHVAVFEAPIDALSHASLQEMDGWKWNGYRLSLGGTSHVALTAFLERHPEISRVTLHMDHDKAGFKNARKIKTMLREDTRFKHIRVSINPPRVGKDYNDKLLYAIQQRTETRPPPSRQKEAAI